MNSKTGNTKTPLQSLHWVDQLADQIWQWTETTSVPKLHVDDMKTPSGRVHTGSLRGVLIHDLAAKALEMRRGDHQLPVISTYVFNDMDPMDGLPHYLNADEYQEHMGKPLFQIPAPDLDRCGIDISQASPEEMADFKSAKTFAEVYAWDFIHAFRKLGCSQEIVWSHQLYQSGQMDDTIRLALDSVEQFRTIYQEVAEYQLPQKWYPFQVICPVCGKLGTTLVTDWDGTEVTFECQPHKVEWAQGCGHQGKISPFGGTGKLLWKADWPAHWKVIGVSVEGAGKDHTSAGGSRDMANAICQSIYHITTPDDIPYEWIMFRGAKMSSSKGVGTSAREFTELFPAEVGRFLFVNKHYGSVIDFDPRTMAIPDLFDAYDEAARVYWGEGAAEADQRLARSFELSQLGAMPQPQFLPRFRDVAIWLQDPSMDPAQQAAAVKGSSLSELELATLQQRLQYAKTWVERYAPAEYQLTPQPELPTAAAQLSPEQATFAADILETARAQTWPDPTAFQQHIYETAKASPLGTRGGFATLYLALLGKTAGPRAAWLILSLTPDLLDQRLAQLAQLINPTGPTHQVETLHKPEVFAFEPQTSHKYPSMTVGVAIIKNVNIAKSNPDLEAQKAALLAKLKGLTTEQLGQYPEITSYRQLYRQMGIDWHSRRPSPEALLRRVAQGKNLYTVNTCVDAYNLVVMEHRVSVGAFDLDQISFPTRLRVADGGEQILLLGDTEPTTLKTGEISYFDQNGPYNLDFNYRDAQRTMVTDQTTNLLINVDGVHDISRAQVEKSLQETVTIIQRYCGGTLEMMGVVSASESSS